MQPFRINVNFHEHPLILNYSQWNERCDAAEFSPFQFCVRK